jgi:putative oxygen-independent coproporphyrinogen III oxidase
MTDTKLKLPPLSLYIHIPWCIKKCPYCDFNSHKIDQNEMPEKEYIQALINDLDHELKWVQGRSLHSIFIGGGTPSLFSALSYTILLNAIRARITFDKNIEITLEANPSTFEAKKFSAYKSLGINRLSIGIQSFNDSHLKALGRVHLAQQAIDAIHIAKQAGFTNFNIDLMHGLPNQTAVDAISDLKTALSFQPTHISWYQLTIEANTEFYSSPPTLPVDEMLWHIQEMGIDFLHTHSFTQYETSAFSTLNQESKHNVNYWKFGDYIGIGAGAHGKITNGTQNTLFRTQKTRQPKNYITKYYENKSILTTSHQVIPCNDIAVEYFMNALRLNRPINLHEFEQRTGLTYGSIKKFLQPSFNKALLTDNSNKGVIETTKKGKLFLNEILKGFMD